jgi:hypothetical protein
VEANSRFKKLKCLQGLTLDLQDSSEDDEISPPQSNRDHLFQEERSYIDDDFKREQEVATTNDITLTLMLFKVVLVCGLRQFRLS